MNAHTPPALFSAAKLHVLYQIANAGLRAFPFPHLYVDNVFPDAFYAELRRHLPPTESYTRLTDTGMVSKTYNASRLVLYPRDDHMARLPEALRPFWRDLFETFLTQEFAHVILGKFAQGIVPRFQRPGDTRPPPIDAGSEIILVRDLASYALGPHTDSPTKLVSLLFYLPADDSRPHLGTALYMPKDRRFTCLGGPHHGFEKFDHVITMPYKPNTLFAFPKTPNSFHGVEPLPATASDRDLIQFDLRHTGDPAKDAYARG